MKERLCKCCGKELLEDEKGSLCEDCAKKKRKKRMRIVAVLGIAAAGAAAGGIYVSKHPETAEKLKASADKIPPFLSRSREAGVQAVRTVKTEGMNYLAAAADFFRTCEAHEIVKMKFKSTPEKSTWDIFYK